MLNSNAPSDENSLPPELELALTSLSKAKQDLIAVGKWFNDLDISDEIIGFHVQQAIEKALNESVNETQKITIPGSS